MSVLMDKHILVVGDETSKIHDIEALLEEYGMHIHTSTCDMVSIESLESERIDIVLLNHLHEGSACVEMLTQLRNQRLTRVLPIIALVENTPAQIDEALKLGAADYISGEETIESVVHKMTVILGEPDSSNDTSVIDLSVPPIKTRADGVKVFVIEDDPLLRNLLTLRLEKTGFSYDLRESGENVLPEIKTFKADVLVLDLMIPGKDGFEILAEIRADADLKSLPVIVFSNRDSQEDRKRAEDLGISGYYVKAMTDLASLMQTVRVAAINK